MAKIKLHGDTLETIGELPQKDSRAPDFSVTRGDLSEVTLHDYSGKRLILNIFPSVDTPTCATSVKRFNEEAGNLDNTNVLCISADLPFAASRFCGAEGISNVETGSVFRSEEFGKNYGVEITTGVLKGLLSRAIIVINESGNVIYSEQVSEIADEPNYSAALAALN